MNIRERANEWLELMLPTHASHPLESYEIIRDLLAEVDLYKGLLEAEQSDCELQRKNKVANWEEYQRLLAENERLEGVKDAYKTSLMKCAESYTDLELDVDNANFRIQEAIRQTAEDILSRLSVIQNPETRLVVTAIRAKYLKENPSHG